MVNYSGEKKVMGKKPESPPEIIVEGFWMSFHLEPLKVPQRHHGLWIFAYRIWTFHEIRSPSPTFCLANTLQLFKSQSKWHLLLCPPPTPPASPVRCPFSVFLVFHLLHFICLYLLNTYHVPGIDLYIKKTSMSQTNHHGASILWDGGQYYT